MVLTELIPSTKKAYIFVVLKCVDFLQSVVWFHSGELDQSNVTEETPEGEEHPPADSENKLVSQCNFTLGSGFPDECLSPNYHELYPKNK